MDFFPLSKLLQFRFFLRQVFKAHEKHARFGGGGVSPATDLATPAISGTSRLVKYHSIWARMILSGTAFFHFFWGVDGWVG